MNKIWYFPHGNHFHKIIVVFVIQQLPQVVQSTAVLSYPFSSRTYTITHGWIIKGDVWGWRHWNIMFKNLYDKLWTALFPYYIFIFFIFSVLYGLMWKYHLPKLSLPICIDIVNETYLFMLLTFLYQPRILRSRINS